MREAPSTTTTTLRPRPSRRNRMPVARINRHAADHGVAISRLTLDAPLLKTRLFTCPTLAPLYHAPIFRRLSPPQQRRYNQLVGLLQNELICFFETEFAGIILPALLAQCTTCRPELATSLRRFASEEREHTQMFRRLNQLAEPNWYAQSDYHILRLPRTFLKLLRWVNRQPHWFPAALWVMLLMEERSLMIGRRYAELDSDIIESQFAATYRAHTEDELRHVQIDWHLLDAFYQRRPAWHRRLNGKLLELFITGLFLKPRRANVRLVELLIDEFPDLQAMRGPLMQAVQDLAHNDGYRRMMYSAEATPIARALFEELPEFSHLRRRLFIQEEP
jgi:hypothetical protein